MQISDMSPQTLEKVSSSGQKTGQGLYGKEVSGRERASRISPLLFRQCPQVGINRLSYNSILNLSPTWVSNPIHVLMENCYSVFWWGDTKIYHQPICSPPPSIEAHSRVTLIVKPGPSEDLCRGLPLSLLTAMAISGFQGALLSSVALWWLQDSRKYF